MSRSFTFFDSIAIRYMRNACSESLHTYRKEIEEKNRDIGTLNGHTYFSLNERHALQDNIKALYNYRELVKYIGLITTIALTILVSVLAAPLVVASTFFINQAINGKIKTLHTRQGLDYVIFTQLCLRCHLLPSEVYFHKDTQHTISDNVTNGLKKLKSAYPEKMIELYVGHLDEKNTEMEYLSNYLKSNEKELYKHGLPDWMRKGLGIPST